MDAGRVQDTVLGDVADDHRHAQVARERDAARVGVLLDADDRDVELAQPGQDARPDLPQAQQHDVTGQPAGRAAQCPGGAEGAQGLQGTGHQEGQQGQSDQAGQELQDLPGGGVLECGVVDGEQVEQGQVRGVYWVRVREDRGGDTEGEHRRDDVERAPIAAGPRPAPRVARPVGTGVVRAGRVRRDGPPPGRPCRARKCFVRSGRRGGAPERASRSFPSPRRPPGLPPSRTAEPACTVPDPVLRPGPAPGARRRAGADRRPGPPCWCRRWRWPRAAGAAVSASESTVVEASNAALSMPGTATSAASSSSSSRCWPSLRLYMRTTRRRPGLRRRAASAARRLVSSSSYSSARAAALSASAWRSTSGVGARAVSTRMGRTMAPLIVSVTDGPAAATCCPACPACSACSACSAGMTSTTRWR